jgi:hypothetical protein
MRMGVGFVLVNHTRREAIRFCHLPACTAREIAGNPVASAVATWYLLHHPADRTAFVSDTHEDWPFPSGSPAELASYPDVTDEVVAELVKEGILRDDGVAWADESDPDSVYVRALRHLWMK